MLSQVVLHEAGIMHTHIVLVLQDISSCKYCCLNVRVSHPAVVVINTLLWCSISSGRVLRVTTRSSQTQM